MESTRKEKLTKFLYKLFLVLGILFVTISILAGLVLYKDLLFQEIKYDLGYFSSNPKTKVIPVDPSFGIMIPKIGVNAKVVSNVDPFNSLEYLSLLTKGVAHAKGTAYPGSIGNVFLFSHSST